MLNNFVTEKMLLLCEIEDKRNRRKRLAIPRMVQRLIAATAFRIMVMRQYHLYVYLKSCTNCSGCAVTNVIWQN